jgi:hypothetical protein
MPKVIKFSTLPPELVPAVAVAHAQTETPRRSAVFAVYYFCQERNLPCNLSAIQEVFGISKSTASEILASGRCRRLHNSDEPETRGG